MSAPVRYVVAESYGQLLAIVREELRVVRSTRDGDVGHAVVEQVLCSQLSVNMDKDALSSLSLAGMAAHSITVVEMRMPDWIDLDLAAIVHPQADPSDFVDILNDAHDSPDLAVGDAKLPRGRGELHPVAGGEGPFLLTVDGDALLPARVVCNETWRLLRAVPQFDRDPVVRRWPSLVCGTRGRSQRNRRRRSIRGCRALPSSRPRQTRSWSKLCGMTQR